MSDVAVHRGPPTASGGEWFTRGSQTGVGTQHLLSSTDLQPTGRHAGTGGVDSGISKWIRAVNEQLESLVLLEEDWDTYNSPPPTPKSIRKTVALLSALVNERLPVPRIRGTSEGGVTIEWFSPTVELIVEAEPSTSDIVVFLRDLSDGEVFEGPLVDSPDALASAFHRLASAH